MGAAAQGRTRLSSTMPPGMAISGVPRVGVSSGEPPLTARRRAFLLPYRYVRWNHSQTGGARRQMGRMQGGREVEKLMKANKMRI